MSCYYMLNIRVDWREISQYPPGLYKSIEAPQKRMAKPSTVSNFFIAFSVTCDLRFVPAAFYLASENHQNIPESSENWKTVLQNQN